MRVDALVTVVPLRGGAQTAVCGRFTLTVPPAQIADAFDLDEAPDLRPRFNLAPGQEIATVQQAPEGGRALVRRRWGLVPSWAKDPKIGSRLINARSETVAEKPAFRAAFKRRRCLVPADGFYEWAVTPRGPKQPHHLRRRDRGLFAIAGLWERWRVGEERGLETCTLLTTEANATVAPIHRRMPVILAPADWPVWLNPEVDDKEVLTLLLVPEPEGLLESHPVGLRVNRPEHDDETCLAPPEQETLF